MEWNLDDGRPIWPQIKERLMTEIAAGRFPMGGAFPTVRELAEDAKVNRNTMQRALSELEAEGLVITNRTAGRTVTSDRDLIRSVRERIAREKIERLVGEMRALGLGKAEIIKVISAIPEGAGAPDGADAQAGSPAALQENSPAKTAAGSKTAQAGSPAALQENSPAKTAAGSKTAQAGRNEREDQNKKGDANR